MRRQGGLSQVEQHAAALPVLVQAGTTGPSLPWQAGNEGIPGALSSSSVAIRRALAAGRAGTTGRPAVQAANHQGLSAKLLRQALAPAGGGARRPRRVVGPGQAGRDPAGTGSAGGPDGRWRPCPSAPLDPAGGAGDVQVRPVRSWRNATGSWPAVMVPAFGPPMLAMSAKGCPVAPGTRRTAAAARRGRRRSTGLEHLPHQCVVVAHQAGHMGAGRPRRRTR